ncbi:MAG: flippase [Candidatus Brocadiaceae bacterium]|nr:flippase [Candidatus Brocadiaceae bacterium]
MSIAQRVIKNTVYVFSSNIINRVITFFFIVYAARILGPKDFGIYGLIHAVIFFFSFFQDLGVGPMGIREIAKNKNNVEYLFNHILSLKIVLAIIIYPLLIITVYLLGYKSEVIYLFYLAGVTMVFSSFAASFGILYIAFEKIAIPSIISTLTTFLSTVSSIVVLKMGYGLEGILWIGLLGNFLGAVISGTWVRWKVLKYKFVYNYDAWYGFIKQSLPFGIIGFLNGINRNISIFFLSQLKGPLFTENTLGYYNAASNIPYSLMMIPASLRVALLPTLAANIENKALVRRYADMNMKFLLLFVSFPLVIVTVIFPEELMLLIFGGKYLDAAPALTILGVAYAIRIFHTPLAIALSATPYIKKFVPMAMLAALINIIFAFVFIPFFGFKGAALAVCISMVFWVVAAHESFSTVFGIKVFDCKKAVKTFVPFTVLLVFLYFLQTQKISIFMIAPVSIVLYIVLMYKSGIVTKEEKITLIGSIKKLLLPKRNTG